MMKQSNEQMQLSGHNIVQVVSPYLFFELLSFKKFHESSFMIPDTILLEKGMIKEWLFNSGKQEGKILKKKKENSTPLNVVKTFCLNCGYNFNHVKSLPELKTEFNQLKKEKERKEPLSFKSFEEKKIIEVVTIDDEVLAMSLPDFINLVAQNKYNEHTFYDKWKIIREKVNNESRIDECYEVVSLRKNHVIESKCHKVIALQTGELTPMSSVDLDQDQFRDVSPSKQLQVAQTKNLEGYKFFDTFLNKKFFSIVQQLIEFIEKNYKCIVEIIRTKFVINKNREPFLVGVYHLKIKPARKISIYEEFQAYSQKGSIKLEDYFRFLTMHLAENQKNVQSSMALVAHIAKKTKCHGDFCTLKVKKIPHLFDTPLTLTGKSKHFNLDPAVHPNHKKTVFSDILIAVRKRKHKVLERLKQQDLIEYNAEQNPDDSSEYEDSEDESHKAVKVCENCHMVYMHIQKFYELDFRSGNLIERKESLLGKKESISNNGMRIKSHSEKKLPPIFSKTGIDLSVSKIQEHDARTLSKIGDKQIQQRHERTQSNLKPKSLCLKSRSHTKLFPQELTGGSNAKLSKLEQVKKVKLDPIEGNAHTLPTKGNRLLALSKATQGAHPLKTQKLSKQQSKPQLQSKLPKAKNYEEAEQNLIQKLSVLPSSTREQFMYYAQKYYRDNLPQELDRKSFSSQYLSQFYTFMLNSELNLSAKNRIRKRPQISLKRLSELTDYPEIVSKSAFHFDTIITDEKTTIPFCVITTRMINGKNAVNLQFENIFIVHDLFDCFIEYIPLVKDVLENAVNKRVILFNYPGQSHTIYNKETPFNLPQFTFIFDKLFYRLSTEKQQLGFINMAKDKFKFVGFGYGGYLLSSYLGNNPEVFSKSLSGVLLANTYKNISPTLRQKAQALKLLYQSNDEVAVSDAFLFYSKAIQSTQTDKEDLQYKAGLNPIRPEGRAYLLSSLLDSQLFQNNQHNIMIQGFENISQCPVHILYSRLNVLFSKAHAQRFLIYQDTKVKKEEIPLRKFIEVQGGHDLMADNYEDLQKYVEDFVLL